MSAFQGSTPAPVLPLRAVEEPGTTRTTTPGCGTSFSQGVSLAPGASTTIDVGCSGGPGQGDTALLVMVDDTNVVAESDETNNVFSQPLT
jgi:hypothetical protein